MPPVPPRRRRARPVADAPIDALLPRSEDLAKGWLLALLEEAPLAHAQAILAADLAREGPRLCDAVLRAIADDGALRRLDEEGPLRSLAGRIGQLAAAGTPAQHAAAVDALIATVWSAVRDELRGPGDAELVAQLSERLGLVGETLRSVALTGTASRGGAETEGGPPNGSRLAPELHGIAPEVPGVAPERAGVAPEPPALRVWLGGSGGGAAGTRGSGSPGAEAPSEALWVAALQDEIRQAEGAPLSLLLVELEDADRVRAVEPRPEAAATFNRFTAAVRGAARHRDILVCETEHRAWIIARDTSRAGAHALATRISEAVRSAIPWRGVPLSASIGIALLGEDGRTAAALIEAAEEARFAAVASGVDVAGPRPEER